MTADSDFSGGPLDKPDKPVQPRRSTPPVRPGPRGGQSTAGPAPAVAGLAQHLAGLAQLATAFNRLAAAGEKSVVAFERMAKALEKAQDPEGQRKPVRKKNPEHKRGCTCEECFNATG